MSNKRKRRLLIGVAEWLLVVGALAIFVPLEVWFPNWEAAIKTTAVVLMVIGMLAVMGDFKRTAARGKRKRAVLAGQYLLTLVILSILVTPTTDGLVRRSLDMAAVVGVLLVVGSTRFERRDDATSDQAKAPDPSPQSRSLSK